MPESNDALSRCSDELTTKHLDELQALCDAATAGPWNFGEGCVGGYVDYQAGHDERGWGSDGDPPMSDYDGREPICTSVSKADREFIALARTFVPVLIAAVRRLGGEVLHFQDDDQYDHTFEMGCFTGDCPHENMNGCIRSIRGWARVREQQWRAKWKATVDLVGTRDTRIAELEAAEASREKDNATNDGDTLDPSGS